MTKKYLEEEIGIMKKLKIHLYNKYGDSINNYRIQKINYLILSINSNIFINFQEFTVYDDYEEYHKRIYYKWEIPIKLNDLFEYYSNYLTFFCRPIFTNFFYNNLLHYCDDKKADIFYKNNFKEQEKEDDDNNDKSIKKNNKNEKNISKENTNKTNLIKDKFEKVNILIFDKETKNKIENSNNILSSIDRVKEEEQNTISSRKIEKEKNNIFFGNSDHNLLDLIKEINDNFNNKVKNNDINQYIKNNKEIINYSSMLKQKIYQKYSSENLKTTNNNIQNKQKLDLLKDKIKTIKFIQNNKKNQRANKDKDKNNISKEITSDNNNMISKNKKIKKLKINFNNFKCNIYNLIKNNLKNFKSRGNKNNSNKNVENHDHKNVNKIHNKKRYSLNNILKKSKSKIIDFKRYSLINRKANLSVSNNKSIKTKTINSNNFINPNLSSIKKNNLKLFYRNTNKESSSIIRQNNYQKERNHKKNSKIYFNKISKSNINYNLLKTYLNNCPNFQKLSKNKSLLRNRTAKTIYLSNEQIKTFSVRLIKSYSKKNINPNKLLSHFNYIKRNYNTNSNLSVNEKIKTKNKKTIPKKYIKSKSISNTIIHRNKDLIEYKKNSNGSKNQVKLNVNLNLHSIFININQSTYYQNNNEKTNHLNKKVALNNNLYENKNSNQIKKTRQKINNNSYKNKTQSYKSRSKTRKKIKNIKNDRIDKIKDINYFINTNSNFQNKNKKDEKDKILKRNNIIFKIKRNKNYISTNTFSKISLSINKKRNIANKSNDKK